MVVVVVVVVLVVVVDDADDGCDIDDDGCVMAVTTYNDIAI